MAVTKKNKVEKLTKRFLLSKINVVKKKIHHNSIKSHHDEKTAPAAVPVNIFDVATLSTRPAQNVNEDNIQAM